MHPFVVVGVLMLAGAVNTAIVGSNGVSTASPRMAFSPTRFAAPTPLRDSSPILKSVVGLQLLTSPGPRNIFLLGRGVCLWRDVELRHEGPGGAVLRYSIGEAGFRVPINLKVGDVEIPVGLGLITVTLSRCASFFSPAVATLSGCVHDHFRRRFRSL